MRDDDDDDARRKTRLKMRLPDSGESWLFIVCGDVLIVVNCAILTFMPDKLRKVFGEFSPQSSTASEQGTDPLENLIGMQQIIFLVLSFAAQQKAVKP